MNIRHWLLISVVALVSCTKDSDPNYFGNIKPKHPADEIWIDASTEPQYMDPNKVTDNVSAGFVTNMFVRLTQSSAKTGEIIPDLAKSWDISKDGKEYTFHLREDALWSDGKPLVAGDVEWSWKRLADPTTGSTYAQMADSIENVRPFREQAIQISGLDSKTSLKSIEGKCKSLGSIKDVTQDKNHGWFFVFIDEEDSAKKKEIQDKLISEIQKGFLGSGVHAQITSSDVIQMKALDDHTFWVKLAKPVPYFLGLIEYPVFSALPRHVIEKLKAAGKEDLWVRPENVVVSGPFILKKEEFKQYKIFEKNPKYFNASKVKLNKIKAIMVEDYNANLNAFKTGQHDWSWGASISPDMLDTVRKFKDYHFDPYLGVYYFQINTRRKPFDQVDVRRALSLAIDRQAIVDSVSRQGQTPSINLVPNGIPDYVGPQSKLYDPEEAKKLLARAGYPEGKGFPKVTLKYNTSEGHKKIAEAIQQMWKSTLGITINIVNMEWRSLLDDQNQNNFDLVRYAWIGDYLDPNTFLSIFLSESANNHTGWKNKKYDQLIFDSDEMLNQKDRFKNFVEAEKILEEDVPMIPIFHYTRAYMKKPYLKGFWPHLQDHHPWKYMWIDERWYKGVPTSDIPDEPWTE